MEHPYAQVLRWTADGETVQWQDSLGEWHVLGDNELLAHIRETAFPPERYSLKPRTISINGHDVPEPLRGPLPRGTTYWIVTLDQPCEAIWLYGGSDERDIADAMNLFHSGRYHATREAALAHAEALLSFTRTET